MSTLQVVLPDFDSINASLAMAAAFASIMATTCGNTPFHTPAPTNSPQPSIRQERALPRPESCILPSGHLDYHRRIQVAMYQAICAAWDWLTLNDGSSQKSPKAGSEAVKASGIMHAAQSAAHPGSDAHDKSNAADSVGQSGPCATSRDEMQAGTCHNQPPAERIRRVITHPVLVWSAVTWLFRAHRPW